MITLYRQKTKSFRRYYSVRNLILLAAAFLILFFAVVKPIGLISSLQSISLHINILKKNLGNNFKDILSLTASKIVLSDNNRQLNAELNGYKIYCSASIISLKKTNDELQKSLDRKNVSLKNPVGTAFVIGKPPIVPFGTITIDLGENSEIKRGDLVLVGNYLIGFVRETRNDNSSVKLFGADGEEKTLLVGQKRLPLIGRGNNSGAYKTKVAGKETVSTGETVILSDYPDYIFGFVTSIEQPGEDQYLSLSIQSPINFNETYMVDIVRDKSN